MRVAIIDAELLSNTKHRFPNLACMKIAGFYKEQGAEVKLKLNYDGLRSYDKVYISKVFTKTEINPYVLDLANVEYGGTGFFYDKAPALPYEIEHHMPDYHLYDEWVSEQIASGVSKVNLRYFTDYSIGKLTTGCFRQCEFCVNRNTTKVCEHSPISEFLDETRPKICLLDDNFLGYSGWKEKLLDLQATGKPFQFKQGLDERILTDEKCELLFQSKYDGHYIFAFDNIADREIIESKLQMIRKYTNRELKFYVFTGFDREDKWDLDFWVQDIVDLFERIKLLMEYKCLPYVMRFESYEDSPFKTIYSYAAAWCNQPSFFTKKTFMEFSTVRAKSEANPISDFANQYPDIAQTYFHMLPMLKK